MPSIRPWFSLIRALWVLLREGVITALPDEGAPPPIVTLKRIARFVERKRASNQAQSTVLSRALNRLGPSWVKLGQFLATRPDIVGKSIALDLELLQDRMDPFSQEEARERVERTLFAPLEELYSQFGRPVAAASVAQVHKAIVQDDDGTEHSVAVKVIRPGIRARFAHDLKTFYTAAHALERFFPATRRLRLIDSVDMLAASAKLEMDLRLEAAGFSEMAQNIRNDEGFRLPDIDWARSGRDCLTMDWVDGIKMNDLTALRASHHDLPTLANRINQAFLHHALRDGFFHADMHPGNLFVAPDGDIVAVDLGISGRIGKPEKRFLAEILYGFITRDYRRVAEVHFEAGYVPAHKDVASFAQALRAVGEPIHGQPADKVSMASLLSLLFEVTELFEMKTQPQLLLLQKTMVVVEGVARSLDPHFNMWTSAEPIVTDYVRKQIGPIGVMSDLNEGARAAGRLVRMAPEFARRLETLSEEIDTMAKNGVRLDQPTIEAIGKAEARHSRSGRVALWIIAAAAVAGVWTLF
ncbi:MAG: 2-polyprenylphenol 6-hydroxylase [Ahrensia sp.]|nr:2-polyprenylphenol 6-hydroxylase [Ahrensia sp.]